MLSYKKMNYLITPKGILVAEGQRIELGANYTEADKQEMLEFLYKSYYTEIVQTAEGYFKPKQSTEGMIWLHRKQDGTCCRYCTKDEKGVKRAKDGQIIVSSFPITDNRDEKWKLLSLFFIYFKAGRPPINRASLVVLLARVSRKSTVEIAEQIRQKINKVV